MKDILQGKNVIIKCLDKGFVKLIDCMPRLIPDEEESGDYTIAEAARTSYKRGTKTISDDKSLIRYLMRHDHTSPFEMIEFKFHMKLPIFVARQIIRHRTACLSGDTVLWFDEPASILKGKRKRSNHTVKEIFDKWHNGVCSKFIPPQKNRNFYRIDPNKEYTVKELSEIIEMNPEPIRVAITKYKIFSDIKPYKIKGKDWIEYANKERNWHTKVNNTISKMNLRMLDEKTKEIKHTHISDIWSNGEKEVFEIEFENGYKIKTTEDHLFYTQLGWKTLKQASNLKVGKNNCVTWDSNSPLFASNGIPVYQDYNWMKSQRDKGLKVEDISKNAGISYHTIRKWLKILDLKFSSAEKSKLSGFAQRGQRRKFKNKRLLSKEALNNIRIARSGKNNNFWKGGISTEREKIGRWTTDQSSKVFKKFNYKCVICESDNVKFHSHHIVPVWYDESKAYDFDNLLCLCQKCHSRIHIKNLELQFMEDYNNKNDLSLYVDNNIGKKRRHHKKKKPISQKLFCKWIKIKNINYIGMEEVFDIEVTGPYHNFIANGIVVHNSLNELSGRYSKMPEEYYIPDKENVRKQCNINVQGSDGFFDKETSIFFIEDIEKISESNFEFYNCALDKGITREQSRIILSLNVYTEWYWKIDLKNLLHFLDLRCDSHAQQETQVYANAILDLIRPIVPWTIDAWEDYSSYRSGMLLTKYEVEVLKEYILEVEKLKEIANASELKINDINIDNKLEKKEWKDKLKIFLDLE